MAAPVATQTFSQFSAVHETRHAHGSVASLNAKIGILTYCPTPYSPFMIYRFSPYLQALDGKPLIILMEEDLFDGTLARIQPTFYFDDRSTGTFSWSEDKIHNARLTGLEALGQELVTSSGDGTVKIWDGEKRLKKTIDLKDYVTCLSIDAKNRKIAAATYGEESSVHILDPETGVVENRFSLPKGCEVKRLTLNAPHQLILLTMEGVVQVWDISQEPVQINHYLNYSLYKDLAYQYQGYAVSDDQLILYTSRNIKTVSLKNEELPKEKMVIEGIFRGAKNSHFAINEIKLISGKLFIVYTFYLDSPTPWGLPKEEKKSTIMLRIVDPHTQSDCLDITLCERSGAHYVGMDADDKQAFIILYDSAIRKDKILKVALVNPY